MNRRKSFQTAAALGLSLSQYQGRPVVGNPPAPCIHMRFGIVIHSRYEDWLCSSKLAGAGLISQSGSRRLATGRQQAFREYVGPTNG